MKEIIGDDYPTYENSIKKFYENKLIEVNKKLSLLKENENLEKENYKLKKKLAEKKSFSEEMCARTYLTKQEHKIHKDNLERLLKENLELRHRLDCIKDDIEIIERHIGSYKKSRKWFKQPSLNADGTIYADEAWHNVTNIQIACDLNSDESLKYKAKDENVKS